MSLRAHQRDAIGEFIGDGLDRSLLVARQEPLLDYLGSLAEPEPARIVVVEVAVRAPMPPT